MKAPFLSILEGQIGVHVFLSLLMPITTDGGEFSVPGEIYSLTMIAYLLTRVVVIKWRKQKWPGLSRVERFVFVLLPCWALPLFLVVFNVVEHVKGMNLLKL